MKENPLFGVAVAVIDSPDVRCDAPLGVVAPPAPALTDSVYVMADEGVYIAVTLMSVVPVTVQTLAATVGHPVHPLNEFVPADVGAVIVTGVP